MDPIPKESILVPLRFSFSLLMNPRSQGRVIYLVVYVVGSHSIVQGINSVVDNWLKKIIGWELVVMVKINTA